MKAVSRQQPPPSRLPPKAMVVQWIEAVRKGDGQAARRHRTALLALADAGLGLSFELRTNGKRLVEGYRPGLAEGLAHLESEIARANQPSLDLFLFFLFPPERLSDRRFGQVRGLRKVDRGLYELHIATGANRLCRISPSRQIATNADPAKVIARIEAEAAAPPDRLRPPGMAEARVTIHRTAQMLATVRGGGIDIRSLYRAGSIASPDRLDREAIVRLYRLQCTYMRNALLDDGRMTYVYYPSRGKEGSPNRNNAIRQWLATLALCRIHRDQPELVPEQSIARNLAYNLAAMYRCEDGLGLIDDRGSVKLGAVAVALIALLESPQRLERETEIAALHRTLRRLRFPNGRFRTFLIPAGRDEFQNFYSGEALLAWATSIELTGRRYLWRSAMASIHHYRRWHLAERNPAFVPWHTQAAYRLWRMRGDEALKAHVFDMNDWLLSVQQIESAPTPDTRGRFYCPNRPFGPPHASSTGVYLEGLADAFALARAVADERRAERYRTAINWGLRDLTQLTFKDETDLFYVADRERLRGGVRTNVYDNVVRIDNVQHSVLALRKILSVFRESDFGQVGEACSANAPADAQGR